MPSNIKVVTYRPVPITISLYKRSRHLLHGMFIKKDWKLVLSAHVGENVVLPFIFFLFFFFHISMPHVFQNFNKAMGEVDQMDQSIGMYRIAVIGQK